MAALLLYQEPAPLNREKHKDFKFTPQKDLSFTQNINSAPLNGIEFFDASRELPVVFSKDQDDNYFPVALLSLANNLNALTGENGEWSDAYIPAFIRRYPFVLSSQGAVCVDEKAPHFAGEEGVPLFDDKGENTETLKNVVSFLNRYDVQHKQTRAYCEALKADDMFKPFNVTIKQKEKQEVRLQGLFVIDEKKLAGLDDAKIAEWFKKGWIAWSYAHIHSLGAIRRLLKRQNSTEESTEEAADA